MRGRNAVTKSKNRRNPAAYQDSTAFEALLGYIYITDKGRCEELLAWLESVVDVREKGNWWFWNKKQIWFEWENGDCLLLGRECEEAIQKQIQYKQFLLH